MLRSGDEDAAGRGTKFVGQNFVPKVVLTLKPGGPEEMKGFARVLGVVHRGLGVVHRGLGVLHRGLGVLHRELGVLHRGLGVGTMTDTPAADPPGIGVKRQAQ